MTKNLTVCFVWHMHQPVYKHPKTGEYLMPWTRLHAIKDYYDMLSILEKYPNIKQTFNLTACLIDQLCDYADNNANDTHSLLTLKDTKYLTEEDKLFILENFFDANYANLICTHASFERLYQKRYAQETSDIFAFSEQEYSDILACFNLVWFDPSWIENNEKLKALFYKGDNYNLEDRQIIIQLQRDIIKQIIPKYKEYFDKGQIDLITSPYYHPIIPLLIDFGSAKQASPNINLPEKNKSFAFDAKWHIKESLKKFKSVFGKKPKGMWPSEQSISTETIELMVQNGIKWTISDEGNLARTLQKEFIRDFNGELENPYDLCTPYQLSFKGDKNISIVFRNTVLSDLIGFEYDKINPQIAAEDLYERIKGVQTKLENTPDTNHVVVIALDGENCWENYHQDGKPFLNELYSLLSVDKTLNISTLSDYLDNPVEPKHLDTLHSGSWINRNFDVWIGDSSKNIAWNYLSKTKKDLKKHLKEERFSEKVEKEAWKCFYTAQGSDWFWWYGEPNDSGQDNLFDELFRANLQHIYELLDKPIPNYLNTPIHFLVGKPLKLPKGLLNPTINGLVDSDEEWANAGCIEIPQDLTVNGDKFLRRIFFGFDENNIYFRFDVNHKNLDDSPKIYIYGFIPEQFKASSSIRTRIKDNIIPETIKYSFSREIEIPIDPYTTKSIIFSEAIENNLWKMQKTTSIKQERKTVHELSIPFKKLSVEKGQEFQFIILTSKSGILQDIMPHSKPVTIVRPV